MTAEYCRKIVLKERKKECKEKGEEYTGSEVSSSSSEEDDESVKHPFALKERTGIVMNIPVGVVLLRSLTHLCRMH